MWRDQVNYFTRQIIKWFFFLWAGARRGRICTGSRSDIHKKIFLKLILCQNVFFKRSTHAMYLKQNWSEPIFICDFVFCHSEGRLDSFFLVLVINPTLLLQCFLHYEVVSSFWRNHCIVGVAFLFVFLFSFSLMWSFTAPCCLKIILSHIKDCILRSFKPWLHDRCAIACFIFKS